jgi:molybdenum-dependent DNA-binding transcriptional regulator ModE
MKANKPKAPKKDAKKAAKKEFEKSLSSKIFEVVKHFGQDAEKVAKDIELVSKFLAKKLTKSYKEVKSVVEAKIEEATTNPAVEKKTADAKKGAVKVSKVAQKVVEKAVKNAKPVVQSVKMAAIATEEKAAKAIAKPVKEAVQKAVKQAKVTPTRVTTRKPRVSSKSKTEETN